MNKKVWYEIFKNAIRNNRAIHLLAKSELITEDEALVLKAKLLDELLESFKSEVEN